MSLMRSQIDSVSGNDRTKKISQHVIIMIFGYSAKRIKLSLTDAQCEMLMTGNNPGMWDMISDSLLSLEHTTRVTLMEDEVDVMVLERGGIQLQERSSGT